MTAYSRRDFLKAAGYTATLAALSGCTQASSFLTGDTSPDNKRPRLNILWISAEDISPDLGCYGDDYAYTPNLDRFAEQSCLYTNAFAPYPVCAPTRSSIITAMYPSTIGSMHMRTGNKGYQAVPPPYVKCFTEYLRAAGYYCTNAHKTDYQFRPPFTAWDESGLNAHWRNRPEGMPFFTVINFMTTHESRAWPSKFRNPTIHDPAKAPVPPYYPDTPVVREHLARYYDNITKMDAQVAHVLRQLAEEGLAENTVVFFWGDHGRGIPRHKRWIYDSGIRVPLMVRWPGKIKPGTVSNDFVSLTDLGPTVMSIAGIKVLDYMQGRPFLGTQKAKPRDYIVAGRERMDTDSEHIRCIRNKRYKYIRNFMPERPYFQRIPYRDDNMPIMIEWRRLHKEGKLQGPQKLYFQKTKPPEEFYDIVNDPHEISNLIDSPKHQSAIKKMRSELDKWIKDTGDLGDMTEEELIELMWPGKKQSTTAAPVIKAIAPKNGKATVTITCETEGASIGYRLGNKGRWLLYSKPIEADAGTEVHARAIRIGYKQSQPSRKIAD